MPSVDRSLLVTEGSDAIVHFRGPFGFLSNFHPCRVVYEGAEYPSSEHAFMAAKSLDPAVRARIAAIPTAAAAKKAGRELLLRPDWETARYGVMAAVVRDKFERSGELRDLLLRTAPRLLIEGNWWHDVTWGRCTCAEHGGRGKNWLGEILMGVRGNITGNG